MGRYIDFTYEGTLDELSKEISDRLPIEDVDIQFQLDNGFFDIFTVLEDGEIRPGIYERAMADFVSQADQLGIAAEGDFFVRIEEIVSLLGDGTFRYVFDRYGSWLVLDERDLFYDFDEIDESVVEGYVSKMESLLASIPGVAFLN